MTHRLLSLALAPLAALVVSGCRCEPEETAEVKQGRELYAEMCALCHGNSGEGYAADEAPRLAQADFLGAVSDDYLRAAIADGRDGTTMSPWSTRHGGPLDDARVNALVAFMRTWHDGTEPELDESPLRGNPARGAKLYASDCESCHGKRGQGGRFVAIGNPQLLNHASDGFLRHAISRGRAGTPMQAWDGKLPSSGVDDLVALLRQWEKPAPPPKPVRAPTKPPPLPLGPVPLNPTGPEPVGFQKTPKYTKVAVVKQQLDRGAKLAFLDARASSAYLREHIRGAVSVPHYQLDEYASQLPKDAWLVCYCACPHAASGKLARKLQGKGFAKVTVLDEGINVWKAKGYPMASGEKP